MLPNSIHKCNIEAPQNPVEKSEKPEMGYLKGVYRACKQKRYA
jgi:hypothetical protein